MEEVAKTLATMYIIVATLMFYLIHDYLYKEYKYEYSGFTILVVSVIMSFLWLPVFIFKDKLK